MIRELVPYLRGWAGYFGLEGEGRQGGEGGGREGGRGGGGGGGVSSSRRPGPGPATAGPLPAGLLGALPPAALVLALVGIANHDNVGGIFRNAAAFGASAILLDRASCDPLYRKAIRVSVGASLLMPFTRIDDPLGPS